LASGEGIAGVVAFTTLLFWLVGDRVPKFGSLSALSVFFVQVMLFRVAHKGPWHAKIRDDTFVWKADILFHFVPFITMLIVVKALPGVFADKWRTVPWIIELSAAGWLHQQWNAKILDSERYGGLPAKQRPKEAEWEEKELEWMPIYQQRAGAFTPESTACMLLAVGTFIAAYRNSGVRRFVNEHLVLGSEVLGGEVWRVVTSLFYVQHVMVVMLTLVTATYLGAVSCRLRFWRLPLVLIVPGMIANLLVAPILLFAPDQAPRRFQDELWVPSQENIPVVIPDWFEKIQALPPPQHLDSSMLPALSTCMAFGFLYSELSVSTISRFRVQSQILMLSLGSGVLAFDLTLGGWPAFVRDVVTLAITLIMIVRLADRDYVGWRLRRLRRLFGGAPESVPERLLN